MVIQMYRIACDIVFFITEKVKEWEEAKEQKWEKILLEKKERKQERNDVWEIMKEIVKRMEIKNRLTKDVLHEKAKWRAKIIEKDVGGKRTMKSQSCIE